VFIFVFFVLVQKKGFVFFYKVKHNKYKNANIIEMSSDNKISGELKELLLAIENNHTNYERRYSLIMQAMGLAAKEGLQVGIRKDSSEDSDNWLVVVIHLPTGQISWHMPTDKVQYDGHSTEQMYDRVRAAHIR
jgi:hypothetical protein